MNIFELAWRRVGLSHSVRLTLPLSFLGLLRLHSAIFSRFSRLFLDWLCGDQPPTYRQMQQTGAQAEEEVRHLTVICYLDGKPHLVPLSLSLFPVGKLSLHLPLLSFL